MVPESYLSTLNSLEAHRRDLARYADSRRPGRTMVPRLRRALRAR